MLKEKRRIYIHLYYNIGKAAEDERDMDKHLAALREELLNDDRKDIQQKQKQKEYAKFLNPYLHSVEIDDMIEKLHLDQRVL